MKKDIIIPKVEDVAVAVVREENELAQDEWFVYLINMKNEDLESVLVSSKGYGEKDNERVKTSVLRHFLDTVKAQSFQKVERIDEHVFGISNEYMVSFYLDKVIYDKKYIFLVESIKEENFVTVPLLNKKGVMIA